MAIVPRGDIVASLNFFSRAPSDPSAKPFNNVDPSPGQPLCNYSEEPHDVTLHDIRTHFSDFSLDHDAFAILSDMPPLPPADFADDDSIRQHYYPHVEQVLRDAVPGITKVHLFDHTVRRDDPNSPRRPVSRVHIDQTAASTEKRVRRYFSTDEADALLAGRYRIINVWRSLNNGPVESSPLGFASTSSLHHDDVVPIEHRYQNGYRGETAAIKFNPKQKWYYLSGIMPTERILLECFDSESLEPTSHIGGRAPHTAFNHPNTRPDAEPRHSIEVRALVFSPKVT
ncbi:hypothetical protein CDD81_6514 [Ophiocordyceps australis]|uniref:Methyltransferase n=1 Tax=Ophiocordyceps australis TaxID=1399860 RepID=A0A2C5YD81_9HYPO|nr:hypothetical protein CDD81_6514 [Ophiocordyceps australis]